MRETTSAGVLGLFLAAGLAGAAYLLADAVKSIPAGNRFVTVKGLAEREVAASQVIWPLSFNTADDDLSLLQQRMEANVQKILDFLLQAGFSQQEISIGLPRLTDYQSQGYSRNNMPQYRYSGLMAVTVHSDKVDLAKQTMQKATLLVKEGIVLIQDYEQRPQFLYTRLNEIKPDMIAEATRNARRAAEQFAEDSGAQVGNIRTARQGLFTITDRDKNSPDRKKIRVVTSVEYYLAGGDRSVRAPSDL